MGYLLKSTAPAVRRGGYFLCTEPTEGGAQDIHHHSKSAKRDDAEQDKGGDAVHFQGFSKLIALGAEAFVFKAKQLGDGFWSGRRDAEVRIHVDAEGIADQADGIDRGAFRLAAQVLRNRIQGETGAVGNGLICEMRSLLCFAAELPQHFFQENHSKKP